MKHFFIILILFALAGCARSPIPIVAPSNAFTESFLALDTTTATSLSQIAEYTAYDTEVYLADYRLDDNTVLGVYDNGFLVKWDADTTRLVAEYDLDIVSRRGLAFSADRHWLVGATQSYAGISGVTVWDVGTGGFIECVTYPCEPKDRPITSGSVNGVTINSAADGFIVFRFQTIRRSGTLGSSSTFLRDPDADYHWQIGDIALDEANRRTAIIYQEGLVELSGRTLVGGTRYARVPVIASRFDPTGKWLVFIRDGTLSLWNTQERALHLTFEDIDYPANLTFDQAGQLLFLEFSDSLTIWDVENATIVAQYDTPGITSIAISQDNRLVVWGDTEGTVHLWAATP